MNRIAHQLSEIASEPTFRTIDGLSIRFVESDRRGFDALLFSPWPESVFAYEPIWSRLAETAHLVAVDLPGFGRSERKDTLLTPRTMGDFIARVADEFQLQKPHVVAPDIGTSASLFAAATHPDRFLSLVVGSGGAAVPITLGDPLREWVFAQDLAPYRRIEALRAVLPHVQTPVQIISGRRDAVVPPINAEYLHERLAHSELHLIDATHFVWEDAADEYAALLNAWWAGGFKTCMNTSKAIATG